MANGSMVYTLISALALLGSTVACSGNSDDTAAGTDGGASDGGASDGGAETEGPVEDPTYYQDILPIVAEHCWTCHDGTNDAAFELTDPAMIAELADWLNSKINGPDTEPPYEMPPFPLEEGDDCDQGLPYENDLRMTTAQQQTFQNWVDDGTPMGDESNPADYDVPPPREMFGDTFLELPPLEMVTSDGQTGDAYLCWSWDLKLEEGAWVTGIQVNPDNLNIVHHAVIMADFSGETAPDADGDPDGDGSGVCPSPGDEVPDATMIATWVPGADPIMVPQNAGMYFPAGTRIASATHYHPTGEGQVDHTSITVALRNDDPDYEVTTMALGAASPEENDIENWEDSPFRIPAGEANYENTWREQHQRSDPDEDFRIYGLFLHAHYAMSSFRVSLERDETGETECLANIPQWDFEWQRTYAFDTDFENMPPLYSGDTWKFDCAYNNTWDNPVLAEALENNGYKSPIPIEIGKGYMDEMCVVHALVMHPYDGSYSKD